MEHKQENKYLVDLHSITNWFKEAKPEPNKLNIIQQLAYKFEEEAELLVALNLIPEAKAVLNIKNYLLNLSLEHAELLWNNANKVAVLDALTDSTVTNVGVAYMANFKFNEALTEVNKSNYSKFDSNGKAIINDKGKIIKSKNYFSPKLGQYV